MERTVKSPVMPLNYPVPALNTCVTSPQESAALAYFTLFKGEEKGEKNIFAANSSLLLLHYFVERNA